METELPVAIARLVDISRGEGFPFVERLVREWEQGANRFAKPGPFYEHLGFRPAAGPNVTHVLDLRSARGEDRPRCA